MFIPPDPLRISPVRQPTPHSCVPGASEHSLVPQGPEVVLAPHSPWAQHCFPLCECSQVTHLDMLSLSCHDPQTHQLIIQEYYVDQGNNIFFHLKNLTIMSAIHFGVHFFKKYELMDRNVIKNIF